MKRVAVYVRVSTDKQTTENQERELMEYVGRREWEIHRVYSDVASGKKSSRPEFNLMLKDARQRKFDILLVWSWDRFARDVKQLIMSLDEFGTLGIEFISLQNSVDTTTPHGRLLFMIFAGLAEFERSMIVTRVKAGLARAKAQGKHCGRPVKVTPYVRDKAAELRGQGHSIRTIARKLGVSPAAVHKALSILPCVPAAV